MVAIIAFALAELKLPATNVVILALVVFNCGVVTVPAPSDVILPLVLFKVADVVTLADIVSIDALSA